MNILIFIPKDLQGSLVADGSAIVAAESDYLCASGEELLPCYYEGNIYNTENLECFEQRAHIAADRLVSKYPTTAKAAFRLDGLVQVGSMKWISGRNSVESVCLFPESLQTLYFWTKQNDLIKPGARAPEMCKVTAELDGAGQFSVEFDRFSNTRFGEQPFIIDIFNEEGDRHDAVSYMGIRDKGLPQLDSGLVCFSLSHSFWVHDKERLSAAREARTLMASALESKLSSLKYILDGLMNSGEPVASDHTIMKCTSKSECVVKEEVTYRVPTLLLSNLIDSGLTMNESFEVIADEMFLAERLEHSSTIEDVLDKRLEHAKTLNSN